MNVKVFQRYDWLVVSYFVLGAVLAWRYNLRFDAAYFFYYQADLQFLTVVFLNLYIFLICSAFFARFKKEDATLCGLNWRTRMRKDYLNAQHLVDFVRALIIIKVVLITHSYIKQAIPLINPKIFDESLLQIDLALHAGINPITRTVEFLNSPTLASFLDSSYFSWYYLKASLVAVFVIVKSRPLHHHFLKSFIVLWALGGLFAVLLPSLGPIYAYPGWFKDVNMPIAMQLQSMLMQNYQALLTHPEQPSIFAYEGIAAFPSLHVGLVALFACLLFHIKRFYGYALIIYTLLIQIGSVFLGWHYAIDGYFAMLLAVLIYQLTAPLKRST